MEPKIGLDNIPAARTAQEANRWFAERARRVTEYNASRHRLDEVSLGTADGTVVPIPYELFGHELDSTTVAIAKLERHSDADVREVNEFLLRSQVRSKVGTSSGFPCIRTGEYDVALRGLVTIMCRYGRAYLREDVYQHVLNDLLNQRGGHDPGIESWNCAVVPFSILETENHVLNIETSRYLTNQLLRQNGRTEAKFDNAANGLTDWMLRRLQSFLCNDFQEYNSRPYQHYSTMSIQNLCDFAEDPPVRLAAQMVLDYVSAKLAVSSNNLRRSVPFRRQKERKDFTPLFENQSDPQTHRFLLLAGPPPRLAEVEPTNHAPWGGRDLMQLAAVGTYRVPDLILDLVVNDAHKSYYQRFHHDGVELYASTPQFLISAGGIWMESVHGHDEWNGDADAGWALPTTLMPTAGGIDRAEFIRIDGARGDHARRNTGVAPGFACGLNPEIPKAYKSCSHPEGRWTFVDASGRSDSARSYGFYAAVYQELCTTDLGVAVAGVGGTFGFFEVAAADGLSFEDFRRRVREQNGSRTYSAEGENEYVTVSGQHIRFTPIPSGNKYRWVISSDAISSDVTTWPLAQGDIVNSEGKSGLVFIDNPFLNKRLVLDMRHHLEPRRFGECTTNSRGLLQSSWGNFELVVPQGDRLVHYWRDMAGPGFPWHRGQELELPVDLHLPTHVNPVTGEVEPPPAQAAASVALIQSTLPRVNPGNFELVVRTTRGSLYMYSFNSADRTWQGPHGMNVGGLVAARTSDHAQALILLALKLGELGRLYEAVITAQEAVTIYRQLDDEARLAWALAHLAALEWSLPDRREDAITARREVTEIYRRLAGTDPATPQYQQYRTELATALILLALPLGELGRHDEAVITAQEAVTIYRQLDDEARLAWALAHLASLKDH